MVTEKSWNKLFCIGQNKTGTSSLHQGLKMLGLRSLHHGPDEFRQTADHLAEAQKIVRGIEAAKESGRPLLEGLEQYDAFSDVGPLIRYFAILDEQYPGSKFIYTTRDLDDWIRSRTKHVERNRQAEARNEWKSKFREVDPEAWTKTWRRHEALVRDHFADRPDDLLTIDICAGEGFEKLCPFLGLPMPDDPLPWRNRAVAQ